MKTQKMKFYLTESEAEAFKTVLTETLYIGRIIGVTGRCPEHGRLYVFDLTHRQTENFIIRIEWWLNFHTDAQFESSKELQEAILRTNNVYEKLSKLIAEASERVDKNVSKMSMLEQGQVN